MINLLPAEEKQKLLSEKEKNLMVLLGTVVLISLICLALILLSIKFYILSDTDYQMGILRQAEAVDKTPDFVNFSGIIQKYNKTLAQLDSFYKKEVYFSHAFNSITAVDAPKGLYLINFSLSRDDNGDIQAGVSGVSDTRDNLLIFKKNIESAKDIKNSSFSPESWINPKNVNFSLTFTVKPAS